MTAKELKLGYFQIYNLAKRQAMDRSHGGGASALRTHWSGWLLAALAILLGVPFWSDMLKKVIAIRGAGKAPNKEMESWQMRRHFGSSKKCSGSPKAEWSLLRREKKAI
jgi:hypothetical protein